MHTPWLTWLCLLILWRLQPPLQDYIIPHSDDNLDKEALNVVQSPCVTQVYMAGHDDQKSDARRSIQIKPYEHPMNAVDW